MIENICLIISTIVCIIGTIGVQKIYNYIKNKPTKLDKLKKYLNENIYFDISEETLVEYNDLYKWSMEFTLLNFTKYDLMLTNIFIKIPYKHGDVAYPGIINVKNYSLKTTRLYEDIILNIDMINKYKDKEYGNANSTCISCMLELNNKYRIDLSLKNIKPYIIKDS